MSRERLLKQGKSTPLVFAPPVRWHWQQSPTWAFKAACHSNVWLQFLIWAARKLSRAFALYVEMGRAKNMIPDKMNVTTGRSWPLTPTLILLVKPSISDESYWQKARMRYFFSGGKRVTVVTYAYFHLSEGVRKDWNHPFQGVASAGARAQALPLYQESA